MNEDIKRIRELLKQNAPSVFGDVSARMRRPLEARLIDLRFQYKHAETDQEREKITTEAEDIKKQIETLK